ncbi:hypothetical protein UFOVP826_30 [uncultured Caudovirales phage]|uniref:Uncharacterized protein n=1 Tax=uncultured Caudovirales phage TaxID=2100421 RepID=A0A6J5P351_9CAUD|nr:hypothetical protein UFOVP826_30 [uncultured Caudovirales phage]
MSEYSHYAGFRIVEDKNIPPTKACFCIGPQNGQPLCPCAMQHVRIENGRYVEKRDLGPVVGQEKCLMCSGVHGNGLPCPTLTPMSGETP